MRPASFMTVSYTFKMGVSGTQIARSPDFFYIFFANLQTLYLLVAKILTFTSGENDSVSNRADRRSQGISSTDTSLKTCKPWKKSSN